MYTALHHLHVTAVTLSLALFVSRGLLMLAGSPHLHARWARIVPHVVDTVLLASAIGLTLVLGQYPFVQGWLTAKVLGLLAYIVLGSLALKYGPTRTVRTMALVAALATAAYIVGVALYRSPWSWLAAA